MTDAPVPILLVDDRRANLLSLEAVLESPRYELVSVTTGAQALAELERREFAVILLDLQMPSMDGLETARKMRERPAQLGQHAPIIFVTAIDMDRERILQAYATGAVDFLLKPLEPAVLAAKVAVFAQLYEARRLAKRRAEEVASERKAGDAEARRFRLLVESVQDYAIFMLDPAGRVATWNVGAERIKGYSAREITGKHFSAFYPPEDVAAGKCERELEIATREGRFEEEGWRVRKDGSLFWANVTITALRNPDAELVGFAKVTRDLTERKRNEERLRTLAAENATLEANVAAERRQRVRRDFLAKAGETLASSLDFRTTLASVARLAVPELADWCSVQLLEAGAGTTAPTQVALVHVDPAKIQHARELAQSYPPDPNAPTGVPQVIRSGKSELYAEVPSALLEAAARDDEHLRLLRELRLESAIVVPLPGRDRILGAISFIYAGSGRRYSEPDLAFAEDFARRAAMAIENGQAHAALSASLEFQERFVAVLGHDLRNPLSSIDMAAAVLRQRAVNASDTATTRVLDRMRSSSARMSRMIEQILDLTRSRLGGGLEVRPAPMDLCDALTGIVEELRIAHPSRSIQLRCSSLPGAWDRDRLEQVFSNLVANGVDYGVEDKPVKIDAHRQEDGWVRVTVHNEGEPIPDALLSQLFNPFRRGGRDSRASKTAGLGLGLYISREIVRAHGGELDVKSSSAEGTTFQVTLPRAALMPAPELRG
jgi:PAS domain S-box-containing protein